MKRILQNSFGKTILCLLVALMSGGTAWAQDTYTLGWGSASGAEGTYTNFTTTSGDVPGKVSFTTSKEGSGNDPAYNAGSSELRLYRGDGFIIHAKGNSITLTPAEGITIIGFKMTCSMSVDVEYSVDGGGATSVDASNNVYTVTGISASSSLKIQNVKGATLGGNTQLRIKTIEITVRSAATTTTIDASGITNTNVNERVPAGSLAATVSSNGTSVPNAAVTWSSDNEHIATIDANTGEVTLLCSGTVNFTASYAGVWGKYRPSSATYTMTIAGNNPPHALWTEDFKGFSNNSHPATCSTNDKITYAYTPNNNNTSVKTQNNAGGQSPELAIANNGTFTATVPLNKCDDVLTFTFKTSRSVQVSTTTAGIGISEANDAQSISFIGAGTYSLTFTGMSDKNSITIVFANNDGLGRVTYIDDINLTGYAIPIEVEAPTFTPDPGNNKYAPQGVTLSCTTPDATIWYSTDNVNWIEYEDPIPVTETTTTIYAKAKKEDYPGTFFSSPVSSATYTLLLTLANDGDNTSNIASFNGKTCDVKLDGRTLSKNDKWNSLCLPFDLTIAGSILDGDGVVAKEIDNASFSANTLTLNFKAVTKLEAGKPYIIKWANAGALVSPVFEDVTIKSGEPAAVRIQIANLDGSGEMYITFEGTYKKLATFDDPRHILYVGSSNNLNYPGPNSWIGAQRAYFKLEGVHAGSGSGANFIKESVIGINDEDPTGIDNVNVNDNLNLNDEPIYNIAGQRISKMQKGINIVNGKKIFVK